MSNDLISRKALLKELNEYVESVYECDFEDTFCTAEGGSANPKYVQGLWEAKEIIEGHPAAYDVDNVVEQLENAMGLCEGFVDSANSEYEADRWTHKAETYGEAIEIVKAGGKNE